MKRMLLAIMLCTAVTHLSGDVLMEQSYHRDEYYHHGGMDPAVDREIRQWIGADQMAYIVEDVRVILDLEKKTGILVNHETKSFVEFPLPVDLEKIAGESLVPRLKMFKLLGEVEAGGKKKKIGEWKCRGYTMHTWIVWEGDRYYETETTSWVTKNVPFSVKRYRKFMEHIFVLSNMDPALIEQMLAIRGVQVSSDSVFYTEGHPVRSYTKVGVIREKEPPPGVYGVPEGYKKKEKLTREDLRPL